MTDKKLTDNEIKKALECCIIQCSVCRQCPLLPIKDNRGKCYTNLKKQALDLINRLQAENERLKEEKDTMSAYIKGNGWGLISFVEFCKNIKAEAYKECIEKVKEQSNKAAWVSGGKLVAYEYTITAEKLNNFLKELVGEQNV